MTANLVPDWSSMAAPPKKVALFVRRVNSRIPRGELSFRMGRSEDTSRTIQHAPRPARARKHDPPKEARDLPSALSTRFAQERPTPSRSPPTYLPTEAIHAINVHQDDPSLLVFSQVLGSRRSRRPALTPEPPSPNRNSPPQSHASATFFCTKICATSYRHFVVPMISTAFCSSSCAHFSDAARTAGSVSTPCTLTSRPKNPLSASRTCAT